jgi:hypothetical protein
MYPNNFLKTYWRMEVRPEIFVAMSFSDQYKERFDNVYAPAICDIKVDSIQLKPNRVDLSKTGDCILTDIMDGIAHSQMVLADLSTMGYDSKTGIAYRNGNVMYEVGLALACRQPYEVLLIRDDRDKFLFDVSTIPQMHLDFANTIESREKLTEELKNRIRERNFINDARINIAISTISDAEVVALKDIYNLKPITSNGRGFYGPWSLSRLLDKHLVQAKSDIESGTLDYALTPLGHVVTQILMDKLKIIHDI